MCIVSLMLMYVCIVCVCVCVCVCVVCVCLSDVIKQCFPLGIIGGFVFFKLCMIPSLQ